MLKIFFPKKVVSALNPDPGSNLAVKLDPNTKENSFGSTTLSERPFKQKTALTITNLKTNIILVFKMWKPVLPVFFG